MLWLCVAAVACLSHADCFCLVVPVCSCRQAWLGAFLAAFAQATVWVLPFLGVCFCSGTDSLGCGVGARGAWSSAVQEQRGCALL